jgi:anti-sigma factor RsiW
MSHESVQPDLFEFYDGGLATERRSAVAAHLSGCASCRAELETWKRTARFALQPMQITGSEIFVQNVMRKVRVFSAELAPFRWSDFARWAYPALAFSMTACAAAFFYVLQPSPPATDSLLIGNGGPGVFAQWPSNPPTEDQLLPSAVVEQ